MNDPRESMEGAPLAPLLGTPKAAYSNVPKRLGSGRLGSERIETGTSRLGMAYSAEGRAPYSQFGLLCNHSRFVGNSSSITAPELRD
jgi:hypothetical protein